MSRYRRKEGSGMEPALHGEREPQSTQAPSHKVLHVFSAEVRLWHRTGEALPPAPLPHPLPSPGLRLRCFPQRPTSQRPGQSRASKGLPPARDCWVTIPPSDKLATGHCSGRSTLSPRHDIALDSKWAPLLPQPVLPTTSPASIPTAPRA